MENIEHLEGTVDARRVRPPRLRPRCTRALERRAPRLHLPPRGAELRAVELERADETLTTNVTGQTNLFEAVRALKLDPVIQIACSSEEYGLVLPDEVPIKETNPLRPLSPYAVSKVAQDYLGYQYFQSYGLKAMRTRGFNHTGPRRGEVFVTSNFASQVAAHRGRACRSR